MKIMIIEDDEIIRNELKSELIKWKYDVCITEDFSNILLDFEREKPQLVLLDIVLPYFNGYYWCEEIRKISTVPIIFISSKTENTDIIMGVQFGADDYIKKPIDLDLTLAKIKAILRRSYSFVNDVEYIKYKDVLLYVSKTKIHCNEKETDITKTELLILETLFKAQGAIVSREKIMDVCWQGDQFIDDNTLAVNINRLRKKLIGIGLSDFILTKKNAGYYLSREGK